MEKTGEMKEAVTPCYLCSSPSVAFEGGKPVCGEHRGLTKSASTGGTPTEAPLRSDAERLANMH